MIDGLSSGFARRTVADPLEGINAGCQSNLTIVVFSVRKAIPRRLNLTPLLLVLLGIKMSESSPGVLAGSGVLGNDAEAVLIYLQVSLLPSGQYPHLWEPLLDEKLMRKIEWLAGGGLVT